MDAATRGQDLFEAIKRAALYRHVDGMANCRALRKYLVNGRNRGRQDSRRDPSRNCKE